MRWIGVCFFMAGMAAAGDGAVPKHFGPGDVEVRLRDGSIVRGEIGGADSIALKTPYGVLTFPLNRILRIKAGFRLAKEKEVGIRSAIAELDNDDFAVRAKAQHTLEELGAQAAELLTQARMKVSAEARSRIDAILKKIGAAGQTLPTEDIVKTDEFEAAGALQFDVLTVKSRIGDLQVKLEDVEAVRWLAVGANKSLALPAHPAIEDWIDSGIDALPGEKMALSVSGSVNLFGNTLCTPDGVNSWGTAPFQTGAVIGKFGGKGKPFLVGAGKQWIPDERARLFVKIYCSENALNSNNGHSDGEFKMQLATGVWAEELPPTATDDSLTPPAAPIFPFKRLRD